MDDTRSQEDRARRAAKRVGPQARKSRWRAGSIDNLGDFQIIYPMRNWIVAGARFDFTARAPRARRSNVRLGPKATEVLRCRELTQSATCGHSRALFDNLVGAGEQRRRPSRSITTETLAKTVDQLDQHYKCSGCNPGKCPDTRRMVFASRTGSSDIAHDRYLCIAV